MRGRSILTRRPRSRAALRDRIHDHERSRYLALAGTNGVACLFWLTAAVATRLWGLLILAVACAVLSGAAAAALTVLRRRRRRRSGTSSGSGPADDTAS